MRKDPIEKIKFKSSMPTGAHSSTNTADVSPDQTTSVQDNGLIQQFRRELLLPSVVVSTTV
jgi:hypothetical protein